MFGALLLAVMAGGVSAVGAAATAIFGGLTPFLAELLIARTGWPLVPGAMIAVVALLVLLVLPVLLTMPETAFPAPPRQSRATRRGLRHRW